MLRGRLAQSSTRLGQRPYGNERRNCDLRPRVQDITKRLKGSRDTGKATTAIRVPCHNVEPQPDGCSSAQESDLHQIDHADFALPRRAARSPSSLVSSAALIVASRTLRTFEGRHRGEPAIQSELGHLMVKPQKSSAHSKNTACPMPAQLFFEMPFGSDVKIYGCTTHRDNLGDKSNRAVARNGCMHACGSDVLRSVQVSGVGSRESEAAGCEEKRGEA